MACVALRRLLPRTRPRTPAHVSERAQPLAFTITITGIGAGTAGGSDDGGGPDGGTASLRMLALECRIKREGSGRAALRSPPAMLANVRGIARGQAGVVEAEPGLDDGQVQAPERRRPVLRHERRKAEHLGEGPLEPCKQFTQRH